MNVYFGGSFFPPHKGHDQMLRYLLESPDVEKVFLVPTSQNPLKKLDSDWDSSQKRKWIDAWVSSLEKNNTAGLEKLVLDWRELDSGGTAYTVNTLSELRSEHPTSRWALCVGDDCVADLSRWKDIEAILLQIDEFWIFVRTQSSQEDQNSVVLTKIEKSLRSLCVWRILSPRIQAVSSSEIRDLMSKSDAKHEALRHLLVPEVLDALG